MPPERAGRHAEGGLWSGLKGRAVSGIVFEPIQAPAVYCFDDECLRYPK